MKGNVWFHRAITPRSRPEDAIGALGLGRNFATRAFPSVVFVKIPRLTPSPPLRSPAAQDGGRVLAQLLARRPRPRSERRGKVRSLSALGRAATRALPFPPSRAKARASSFFRRSVWESRPPLAPRARRAPPLTARSLDFLDTQVTPHRRPRLADPQRPLEVRRAAPSPPLALKPVVGENTHT